MSMTHRSLLAVLVLLVGLCGCQAGSGEGPVAPSDPTVHTVETVHGPIEVPLEPRRIVALSYETVGQLASLGAEVVGAPGDADERALLDEQLQRHLAGVASIGPAGDPDLAAIAALEPDLIVGDATTDPASPNPTSPGPASHAQLTRIAPTVIATGVDAGDWKSVVATLADASGTGALLTVLRNDYNAKVDDVRHRWSAEFDRWGFAPIAPGHRASTVRVLGPDDPIGAVHADLELPLTAGIGAAATTGSELAVEEVGDLLGPTDVVIVHTGGLPAERTGRGAPLRQLFRALRAAGAGQVHRVEASVTDYRSAMAYLDALDQQVLAEL